MKGVNCCIGKLVYVKTKFGDEPVEFLDVIGGRSSKGEKKRISGEICKLLSRVSYVAVVYLGSLYDF